VTNVSDKNCRGEQIKYFMFNILFLQKVVPFVGGVEKCDRIRQSTEGNIIQRMCHACWITKATDTQSEHAIFFLWHGNNGYTNALQCYVSTYVACFVPSYPVDLMKEMESIRERSVQNLG
jgi:hypothetical protein